MKTAVAKSLFKSHDYHEFRKLISDLLLEGKSTGNEQSESHTRISGLNDARMDMLDKTITISEENIAKLKSLKKKYIWLVLAEGWCADSSQILPVLNKMAHESGKIDLKIVLPEENEDLMDLFLTDDVRKIPKVIVVDKESGDVYGSWGPMPKGVSDLIRSYKEKNGCIDEAAKADLQTWYMKDKGISTQNELIGLMLEQEQLHLLEE
ncbi:thioredoxin family protein [Flavobacterium limnophilum]|uniref:thioredoxin family protein n=1 Tax=Flavobacterium limnophilum TaxID=3003262 RepID=UPI0024828638|nr:thioredoxin family protein [Flavobacterium limnophilum]